MSQGGQSWKSGGEKNVGQGRFREIDYSVRENHLARRPGFPRPFRLLRFTLAPRRSLSILDQSGEKIIGQGKVREKSGKLTSPKELYG